MLEWEKPRRSSRNDFALANFNPSPKSIPINLLEKVEGTPLADQADLDIFEFIRTIAVTRIANPKSYVRLSAGRKNITREAQALCFHAGANSIFYGETLLTQDNPDENTDQKLFSGTWDKSRLNLTL